MKPDLAPVEQRIERDLPYLQVVPAELADGIVMRKDGGFVAGFEIGLVPFDSCTDDELEETSARLGNVLRSLPEGHEIQLEVSRDVVKRLRVPRCSNPDPVMVQLHEARKKHLATSIDKVLENTVHLYVAWSPDRTQPGYLSILAANLWSSIRARHFREKEHEALLREFCGQLSAISAALREAGYDARTLGTQELVGWIRRALNPGADPPPTEVGPWEYLADRVALDEVDVQVNHFRCGTRHVAVLSHRTYPDVVIPFCVSPMMRLPFPFRYVMGIDVTSQAAELKAQQNAFKRSFAWTNRSTVSGHEAAPDKVAQTKFSAHNAVIDAMLTQSARLLPVTHNLVLWADDEPGEAGPPEALEERVRQARSTWTQSLRGSDMLREGLSTYPVWTSTLPGWLPASGRRRKYLSPKVADMMAGLLGGRASRGACGRTTFFDRDGGLIPFSIFEMDREMELLARNIMIFAQMGGGKSFLLGTLILGTLAAANVKVRSIDVGLSTALIFEVLGGICQRYSLTSTSTDVVNPCDVPELTDDALDYLLGFLSVLLTRDGLLDMAVEGTLVQVLKKVYSEKNQPGAVILGGIEDAMRAHSDPRLHELAMRLALYTEGPFGRILNRRAPRRLDEADLVYYDYQDCPERLVDILVHANTADVLNMAHRVGPSVPKMLCMDEAWRLTAGKGARLVQTAGRCSRKLRMSFISVSQSLGDFLSPALRDAVVNNAEIQFLLKCTREDFGEMAKVFKLNEAEIESVKSLRTVKGEYAESFLIQPKSRQVIRNKAWPECYWLVTSDPPDRERRDEAFEKGRWDEKRKCFVPFETRWEAIKWLAREYPKGMEAAGLGSGRDVREEEVA
ncbi:MAG: TraC family protein [Acidobacteriota bacterium]